jgi:uncharacterized membrane protein YjgN (DUF898 family)
MNESDVASEAAPAATPARSRVLEIRFTGSGSEYFRIWAVNLLLILLSCGLYLPFAKIRRIRYVYANTLIDGEALAFHGDVWRMFRGFMLLAVLMAAYTFAGQFSPAAALPAFVLLCLVWPALWRAALQFRLRLGFEGSLAEAYLGFLPVYVPAVLMTALLPDGNGPSSDPGINTELWSGVLLLVVGLMAPWSTALLKRYQHRGYRIAGECSEVVLRTRSVYFIGLKVVMLGLAMGVFAMCAAFVLGGLMAMIAAGKMNAKGAGSYIWIVLMGLSYLLFAGGLLAYYAARVQNLVWSNTRSASLQFRSELSGLTRLNVANWVLIVLTLGLYRPFAVMAVMRLRLEAVRIEASTDPAMWTAPGTRGRTDASGDVAGDFFGLDVGL